MSNDLSPMASKSGKGMEATLLEAMHDECLLKSLEKGKTVYLHCSQSRDVAAQAVQVVLQTMAKAIERRQKRIEPKHRRKMCRKV
eukprot:scaffold155040_cov15-Prasinocladus_malaysianus.AAC.1